MQWTLMSVGLCRVSTAGCALVAWRAINATVQTATMASTARTRLICALGLRTSATKPCHSVCTWVRAHTNALAFLATLARRMACRAWTLTSVRRILARQWGARRAWSLAVLGQMVSLSCLECTRVHAWMGTQGILARLILTSVRALLACMVGCVMTVYRYTAVSAHRGGVGRDARWTLMSVPQVHV